MALKATTGVSLPLSVANGGTGTSVGSGAPGSRPAAPFVGQEYYDTTLALPVWCKSTGPSVWINAAGATV